MKWRYLYIGLIYWMFVGCFEDSTTYDTVRISKIFIDTVNLQKEYDRDKNETFTIDITQYVRQDEKELPLSFEWQMNYEFYSDSSVLYVECQELGSYPMRVKVSNEHSSAFYEFKLNINTPYEEGVAVLSENEEGKGMLSFMRYLADGTSKDFETYCLQRNNPDIEFPRVPTDIKKRENQLYISYKQDPSIYIVNAKTLEIENVVAAPEYPDFIPECMLLPDNTARTAIVICENGSVYNLASMEGLILNHTRFTTKTYAKDYFLHADYQVYSNLWDNEKHTLIQDNGYGATDLNASAVGYGFEEVWKGEHELIAMFEHEKGNAFTVLTELNGEIWKTSLGNYLYYYDYDISYYVPQSVDYRDVQKVIANPHLKKGDPYVGNPTFQCLFYAQQNKIYRWYYSSDSFSSDAWNTLELSDAVITALALSPDQSQLYVGAYRPGESGENGYMYIYDVRSGNLIKACENMAYKPVKIMYKEK